MKPILPPSVRWLAALPLVALTAACTTQGEHGDEHWSQRSITNSMSRTFLGYDESRDGDYIDFQYKKKKEFNTTCRRYFFHHNPYNPFETYDPSYFRPRYPHSIVPDTVTYIQEPLSSVIGTMSEGGGDEWAAGMKMMATGVDESSTSHKTASYMRSSVGLTYDGTTTTPQN